MSESFNLLTVVLINDRVPGVEHLQLNGERLIWGGDFDYLKKLIEEGLQQRAKWSSPGGTAKLTVTWYRGKNQILSLRGKDSPALKVRSINLVRSKDPSGGQSRSRQRRLEFKKIYHLTL